MLISREVARKLFPNESAVGKNIYSWNANDVPHRVVGVVDRLIRPNDYGSGGEEGYSMVLPIKNGTFGRFVLRTDPERRAEVQKAAVAALERNSNRRIILRQDPFTDVIAKFYAQDRSMAWLLAAHAVRQLAFGPCASNMLAR